MPKKKSPNSLRLRNSTADFLTFAYQTGGDGVEVRVEDGTIWLSQKNIGRLFETTPENVLVHLKNIYAENELSEPATAKEYLAVQTEGNRQVQRSILNYSLDAIIAVGYRVNSKRATAFRQWATGVLRDFTLRGYVMDRKRMENGAFLDEDYFERLLEEIREIRLASHPLRPCQPLLGSASAPQPRQSMDERQNHMVSSNPLSAGLQIATQIAWENPPIPQSFLKRSRASHPQGSAVAGFSDFLMGFNLFEKII